MRLRFAVLGVVEQESIDRFFENVKYKNSIFVRKTIAQRKIIQKQKEQSWRIYLIYLSYGLHFTDVSAEHGLLNVIMIHMIPQWS